MIDHTTIGTGFAATRKLKALIDKGDIQLAGNKRLRIYGALDCYSGKRMKKENRVFFVSEKEAIEQGYRCCRNCWSKCLKV